MIRTGSQTGRQARLWLKSKKCGVGCNATTFSSTGLTANKTYYHRVRAYNVLGNSAYSNTASANTLK